MKLKLDENIPTGVAAILRGLGHDADTVVDEGLKGRSDPDIRAAAVAEQRFVITQDLGFGDIRLLTASTSPGVLLVRLRNPGRQKLTDRIHSLFETEDVEDVEAWKGCLVVATERKLRVRRR